MMDDLYIWATAPLNQNKRASELRAWELPTENADGRNWSVTFL